MARAKTKKTAKAKPATAKSMKKKTSKPAAKAAKPIDLYDWPTPNGFKITILLEEAKVPYNRSASVRAETETEKPSP